MSFIDDRDSVYRSLVLMYETEEEKAQRLQKEEEYRKDREEYNKTYTEMIEQLNKRREATVKDFDCNSVLIAFVNGDIDATLVKVAKEVNIDDHALAVTGASGEQYCYPMHTVKEFRIINWKKYFNIDMDKITDEEYAKKQRTFILNKVEYMYWDFKKKNEEQFKKCIEAERDRKYKQEEDKAFIKVREEKRAKNAPYNRYH